MQYYTFDMDEPSRNLCTFATPFGLYRYCRLPMGVSEAPDIATEIMHDTFADMTDVEFYMDDIGCFSDSWEEHLQLLKIVLQRLQSVGFTINPLKCEWAVEETDFLGHWLTPTGIKPWKKKIDAVLRLQPPSNIKELRAFLGMVNYYRDVWPQRTHTLAPLTAMTGKAPFHWTPLHQKAFEQMKALISTDALLAYPDPTKPYDIESDASDYQLGSVIKQNNHPVAYFSRKLNSTQKNYTTIEKELLSIVETFKEFRSILLGSLIRVHTDHKNLTHDMTTFNTQRVLRWRLQLEEFKPIFLFKTGISNVLADAFSRLPTDFHSHTVARHPPAHNPTRVSQLPATDQTSVQQLPAETYTTMQPLPPRSILTSTPDLAECLLEHPVFDDNGNLPFRFATIREYQQQDHNVANLATTQPDKYTKKNLGGHEIITLRNDGQQIIIPNSMLEKLVHWYHQATTHALGATRLYTTIHQHFHHPKLRSEIQRQIAKCDLCQRLKRGSRQYGDLAPRIAPFTPWQTVAIDCIGPWVIELRGGKEIKILALTTIDIATNLLEIEHLSTKTSLECAHGFDNGWLSRYPRPLHVIHDNGPEFVGRDFQHLLHRAGITSKPTTSHNPQGNSVIEAIHKSIGHTLRTLIHIHRPQTKPDATSLAKRALSTAMHATRCAASQSLNGLSPGTIAFRRDMFVDIPYVADILTICRSRQALIDSRLLKENAKRISHDYRIGEPVMKKSILSLSDKLVPSFTGPYIIEQVHTNGTCTIRLTPNQTERINIRRLKPYRA